MNVPDAFKDRVRPGTPQDAAWVARHLRYDDLEEILVGKDITASRILMDAQKSSKECFVHLWKGRPSCIWGAVPTDHGACVWMLGTDDLDFLATDIIRISTWFIAESLERYGFLYNWVDQRNTKSMRYLKHLGFAFGEPIDNHGHPFVPFWKKKENEHGITE
jgi:hypothetical protein